MNFAQFFLLFADIENDRFAHDMISLRVTVPPRIIDQTFIGIILPDWWPSASVENCRIRPVHRASMIPAFHRFQIDVHPLISTIVARFGRVDLSGVSISSINNLFPLLSGGVDEVTIGFPVDIGAGIAH